MAKSGGNVVNPLDLIDTVGVDGFRYYVLAETAVRQRRRLQLRGPRRPVQRDLANNLGNLAGPRRHGRRQEVRRHRPGAAEPTARSPTAAADRVRRRPPRRGTIVAPSRGTRRDVVARSARRTPTSRPTSRGSPSPGPAVDAVMGDALEALRIVAILASPAVPAHGAGDLGADRLRARTSPTSASPSAAAWGGYPGGLTVTKGDAAVPPHHVCMSGCFDTPLPRPRRADPRRRRRRRRGRPSRRRDDDGHGRLRPGDVARGAIAAADRHADVWATVGLHPHEASHGVDTIARPVRPARGSSPSARPGSTTTTTTRRATCSARRSPPRSASPTSIDLPLVIHTREAWDDTFDILDAEGMPERTIFHCFTGGPDEARALPRPRGVPELLGDRHVQDRRRRAGRRADRARSTACWSRPTRPYLAPVPHRGQPQPAGLGRRSSARVHRRSARRAGRRGRRRHHGQRRSGVSRPRRDLERVPSPRP